MATGLERHQGGRSQFAIPHGIGGWLAGQVMAVMNAGMIARTAELLDVRPDDAILEIGFGAGTLVRRLAERAPRSFVAGIDVSEAMLQQAARRNRQAMREGRVELRLAGAEAIPYPEGRFDKVCAVNSFQLWPDKEAGLREVRRVLKPGGLLVLALHGRKDTAAKGIGLTEDELRAVRRLAEGAGFSVERLERAKFRFGYGEFIVARRATGG